MQNNLKYPKPGFTAQTKVPVNEKGEVGIRATLNNLGVSNSRIGYDDKSGTVTLDGGFFMKPSTMDDVRGISYADENAIRREYGRYRAETDPSQNVKVSDYYTNTAGRYGLTADSLGFSNGTVTIGGVPVAHDYIDENGKAWASPGAVQKAAEQYIENSGLKTPGELLESYNSQYLTPAYEMLEELKGGQPFTYDPEKDPVYAAYSKLYQTEGDRASRDAIADYSANTGGYVNSAAVTAGALMNQYYAALLASEIPALAKQAYERYSDNLDRKAKLTETMLDLYRSAYQNAASANSETLKNIIGAAKSNTERDANERRERRLEAEEAQADKMFDLNLRQGNLDYYNSARNADWTEILNTQKKQENDLMNIYREYENRLKEYEISLYPEILRSKLSESSANAEYRRAMAAKALR